MNTIRRSTLTSTLVLTLALTSVVWAKCTFPKFMQLPDPWAGDYKDGPLVAYVKPTFIMLREAVAGGFTSTFRRVCIQNVPGDKYLIMHKEKGQPSSYLCMQFLKRSDSIVQVKTSKLFPRQSHEMCNEEGMAIDSFPLVQMSRSPEKGITCPFRGGYNMNARFAHPNNTRVCGNLLLLMRMESECEQGGGITIDFREEKCVPKSLPRKPVHRAHCVAYWTQDKYTFIILRHSEENDKWFCLRTSDPLSNIQTAYLWLEVVCDTSERPLNSRSSNYLKLELTNRSFSSTCVDEIEICSETKHYCNMGYGRHCAHTCQKCSTENQIGLCAFEEQYRGDWVDSGTKSDSMVAVGTYSLKGAHLGQYNCMDIERDTMPDKRVLLELYNNGCFPRYACVEMEKVTSSVMKFRVGERLMWPLPDTKNEKELICKKENFQIKEGLSSTRVSQRPARLLVNTGHIREVNCGLPETLQYGIAFREDGKHCGGCLNYEPHTSPNHFIVRPVNCTVGSSEQRAYRNMPIQYSCLASFQFRNNSYSVVTKTSSYDKGMGQYLVWIFTPQNQIKVMKAADTYLYETGKTIKSELIQAQFSILRNDNLQCRNFVFLPRTTSTTTASTARTVWSLNNYNNNNNNNNDPLASMPSLRGDQYITYSPNYGRGHKPGGGREGESGGGKPGVPPPSAGTPKFENSVGEDVGGRNSARGAVRAFGPESYAALTFVVVWACAWVSGRSRGDHHDNR